jgi:hypothetical protein
VEVARVGDTHAPPVRDGRLLLHEPECHVLWYVTSAMAQCFAIGSKREAQAFLAHDLLGPHLIECTRLVMAASEKRIGDILGYPDDMKFRSPMTLFDVSNPGIFADAINAFYLRPGPGDARNPVPPRRPRRHLTMTDSTSYPGLKGTVVAVASNAKHEFSKPIRDEITLVLDLGVKGDAHAGHFIQHRYLARTTSSRLNDRKTHLIAPSCLRSWPRTAST